MSAVKAALAYAAMGIYVFPCNGKQPLVGWRGESTTDAAIIRGWWTQHPDAGIGVDCAASGLVVVDVDVKNGIDGPGNWKAHVDGHQLPSTFYARTPSGGWHLWYRDPDGMHRNSAGRVAAGVDVRAAGGYVLAPGSPGYTWHAEQPLSLEDIPAMPDGILPISTVNNTSAELVDHDERIRGWLSTTPSAWVHATRRCWHTRVGCDTTGSGTPRRGS
jgi:Bifunctional DNA primase/polymerase, N-terminal